ncbi:MAG: hypothetical protein SGI73_13380 [Chloroflexota bacterium]|nr:hypothetical protein [Chloroflexota bacterium]
MAQQNGNGRVEVQPRAMRRTFTAEYRQIVALPALTSNGDGTAISSATTSM